MNKLFHFQKLDALRLAFLVILLSITYIASLLFLPFRDDKVSITVGNPAKISQAISTKASLCGYRAVSTSIVVRLIEPQQNLTGISLALASFPSFPNFIGCSSFDGRGNLTIPSTATPGVYQLRIDLTYKVNTLRTVTQTVYSNKFEVVQ